MTSRFQTPKGTQGLLAALLIGAVPASFLATACSDASTTPATAPDSGTPTVDSGSNPPPDAGSSTDDAASTSDSGVGPVGLTSDPDCSGKPKSCCFGTQKYSGTPGADMSCGPNRDEDCCAIDDITGGTFNRMNDPSLPATVPDFRLGRYLVTTARFAVWIQEGGGLSANAPPEGAGAHPTLPYPQTGWDPAWNSNLSSSLDDLYLKVKTDPGSQGWGCTLDHYPQNPNFPVDCIDYYLMNAFCAWDGGYAITEAQWEYAARGGAEQRQYAWGSTAPDSIDISNYCIDGGGTWGIDLWCNNPVNPTPVNVGASKNGKGKWGTYDLMGNLMNMTTDDQGAMPASCTNDCVNRPDPRPNRAVARGIAFLYPNNFQPAQYSNMMTGRPITVRKDFNGANFGFRCAYPKNITF